MSSPNPFVALQRQLAGPPLQVGDVVSGSDGAFVVELPGGGRINARGSAAVGQRVWVRAGLIEGTAPTLPIVSIEV